MALGYNNGHHTAEDVWQALGDYVRGVARMISDREGTSKPPAVIKMLIPA
ncbi:hypothetical protein [Komagataeibacter medellinensis]|nr:hypothetical protein [Komagataeibacter medellinensis]